MNSIFKTFLIFLFLIFLPSFRIIDSIPESNTLHEAVYEGDIKKVRAFIKKGADVNLKNENGHAPLHYAARLPCCDIYGEKGKKKENIEIAKLLIKQGADVNLKVSGRFILEGASLHLASHNGLFKVVELLIKEGADVNVKNKLGSTPLHSAHRRFSNGDGSTILRPPPSPHNLKTQYKTAKLLIEKGADVNAKNNSGNTLLHFVENIKIIKLLLENGADVNAGNNLGETPLHLTIYEEIARLLIENGADVNAKTKKSRWNYASGSTPLHHALTVEIAKVLLENGADINARNKHGKTPIDTRFSSNVKNYLKSQGGYSGLSPTLFIKNLWQKVF